MPTRAAVWERPDPLRVLVEASASLLAVPELSTVVEKILDLASRVIHAEAYAMWRTKDGMTWQIIAAKGLSQQYKDAVLTGPGLATLTQEPIVIEDLRAHPYFTLRGEYYQAEGIVSMMVLPLRIAARLEGTIAFYWKTRHAPCAEDLQYAEALGNLASSAINTAELYEHRVMEEQRSRFLAETSALLASSLDYEETLKRVTRMAVPGIADWCSVRVIEQGQLTRTAVAHADPTKLAKVEEYFRLYPDDVRQDRGLGRVLATGTPELIPEVTEETLVHGARDATHLALLRALGMRSVLIVPLNARGRTLGAITMIAAESGREFGEDDLRLAEDLARRSAVAVDNAQLHRALQESEERFRTLIEQSPVSTVIFDAKGQLLEANRAFFELFGVSMDDAPSHYSILEDEQLISAGVIEDVRRAFRGEENVVLPPVRYDAARTSSTGRGNLLWAESLFYPIRSSSGEVERVVLLHTDVTERINAERTRRAHEETLRRTEKLAAAGRLAASVAHEINNPLEAITNLLFLVREDSSLPEKTRHYLAMADEELRRVAHVVRQTLGFYRENVSPEVVDISNVARDIVNLYQKRVESKRIALVADYVPNATALVIPGEIKQVIANLLTNALDACSEGGRIRIEVAPRASAVTITVEDDGVGIDPKIKAHLFEPFFTTKKDVGTGLGLWVSREIVERHSGAITVESRTEHVRGSRFQVTLPQQ